jgi:hypothetical protein
MMPTELKTLASSDVPSLLTIAHKFGDWLITLLQLYIIINSAFIGWMLTGNLNWNSHQKATVTIVYGSAMTINFVWMLLLRKWLRKMLEGIQEALKAVKLDFSEDNIISVIKDVHNRWWYMLFAFHLISDLVLIVCIWCLTGNECRWCFIGNWRL